LRYTGSLLHFVAGLLEQEPDTPLAGMERYYSGEAPYQGPAYQTVSDFVEGDAIWSKMQAGNVLMTILGPPGRKLRHAYPRPVLPGRGYGFPVCNT
jgi:hypothetical protein